MIKLKKVIPIICAFFSVFNTNPLFAMDSTSHKAGFDEYEPETTDEIIKHYTFTQGYEAFYNSVHLKLNEREENFSFKEAKALVNYLYGQSYSDRKVLYSGMSEDEFKKMKFKIDGSPVESDKICTQILNHLNSKRPTPSCDRIIGIRPNKKLTMQHRNFLSTSIDEKVARKFGDIILEIEFENKICGEYIAEKSMYPDEKEVLIPPGAVFEIINIQNLTKLPTDENEKILVSVKLTEQKNPFDNN